MLKLLISGICPSNLRESGNIWKCKMRKGRHTLYTLCLHVCIPELSISTYLFPKCKPNAGISKLCSRQSFRQNLRVTQGHRHPLTCPVPTARYTVIEHGPYQVFSQYLGREGLLKEPTRLRVSNWASEIRNENSLKA